MGRGASRTDALEPDCLESWTKETESTWMTSTEINIPLSSIHSIPSDNFEVGFISEKTISPAQCKRSPKILIVIPEISPLTKFPSLSDLEFIS
ncbi:Brain and acute leukemia cytoplasmic protein [Oryzias melastigma]|uniref:Brain and acute leukemia cytoplasmic protein n=1 Tax=Oryzias melastigma TaxID=30732 RepID=A0A834BSY0_ORYME|nr:Brain and acute leukemia cytoplasmic protein [Oryzias melastigma]